MQKKSLVLIGLGFEFTGLVLAFLFLGRWFDQTYQLNGLGTAAGAFAGIALWLVHLVIVLKSIDPDQNSGDNSPQ